MLCESFLRRVVSAACLFGLFSASAVRAGEAASDASSTPVTALATIKFELDVLPILTKAGCNSGPCHGKSRGQNGFQ